jgi:hypothetical protein
MNLRASGKTRLEVVAVVAVYILFLIVGLYTQTQATLDAATVEIIDPPDGTQFQSSPLELAAIVTNQQGPLPNASTRVTVLSLTTGETEELRSATDNNGIVKVLFPAQSGNYSWYVATEIEGYPTIVSRLRSFSARLALIVDCLHPCSRRYPLHLPDGYLDLQVMVSDMNGNPIESANVTFYINSTPVFLTLTNPRGIATLFVEGIPPGRYIWFASASKDGKVGASHLSVIDTRTTLGYAWSPESLCPSHTLGRR